MKICAQVEGLTLATLDKRPRAAAGRAGVELFRPGQARGEAREGGLAHSLSTSSWQFASD
ncbi:MAG TPA: hypothetical protein VG206_03785 [Terriglobia bacterium]|nr:hypothetical protein [Terriglobia bacterium]